MKITLPFETASDPAEYIHDNLTINEIVENPDKLEPELEDFVIDNYYEIEVDENAGNLEIAGLFADYLGRDSGVPNKFIKIYNAYGIAEVDDNEFIQALLEKDILANTDEIVDFLDTCYRYDWTVADGDDFIYFLEKGKLNYDYSGEAIDQEIDAELVNTDWLSMNEDLAGGLYCYLAYVNNGYGDIINYFQNELYWDVRESFSDLGDWGAYINETPVVDLLNDAFEFRPKVDNLYTLSNYKKEGDYYVWVGESPGQLHLEFESFKEISKELKVLLEGLE